MPGVQLHYKLAVRVDVSKFLFVLFYCSCGVIRLSEEAGRF